MKKISKYTVASFCLSVAGMIFFTVGCENPHIRKASKKIKESSVKTGEAAKELGRGISEETKVVLEEIKKGTNVIAAEIKEGGIFVSKKGEVLIDRTKEEFSEAAITARIKVKYAKSPKVSALHINVTTEKGQVILSGSVHCKEEIIEAINLAMSVEGVDNVTSLLKIRK